MPTKPTTLPIWATNTGSNVVTGLAIDNINWQTGTTSMVRYTFTGSPDLSAVIVGHQLVASGCTDDTHNGTFQITAVNNASDWIEVVNAAVTDATLDEASSPGTAIAKTGTALIQAPTSSKQTMGWLNSERPPAGYFNWLTNLAYSWFSWLDGWSTDIETDISDINIAIAGLGFSTSVVTANTTAAVRTHYFVNSADRKKITLPSVFSVGASIRVTGMGAGGFMLTPATGDSIYAPSTSIPTTGTALFSDQQYTSVELQANVADSSWVIVGGSGTYTIRDPGWVISTLAGSSSGSANGVGTAAQFAAPLDVAVDSAGNIFVADSTNHRIRKIDTAGTVTTLAGSSSGYSDGTGTAAQFNQPWGVAVDSAGNVFVGDRGNYRIRKIDTAGVVTTFAGSGTDGATSDGTGTAARFNLPQSLAFDTSGNLFVVDRYNYRIRKITSAGVVTTFAGSTYGYTDGTGTAAQFSTPQGIAVDSTGNVYVSDSANWRIRKINTAGVVTTVAGSGTEGAYSDGTGTAARFNDTRQMSFDSAGNLFIADALNYSIRKMDTAGVVTTVAGSTAPGYSDGVGTAARFNGPHGIGFDSAGNFYVGDNGNNRIRKAVSEDA